MATLHCYIEDTSTLLHDQSFLSRLQNAIRQMDKPQTEHPCQAHRLHHPPRHRAIGLRRVRPAGHVRAGGRAAGALPGAVPASSGSAVANAAVNSLQTIPTVERYPFIGFFNPYVQASHAGVKGIIDVSICAVNWGGAVRPALAFMPWEDLQAYGRAYATQVTSYPYYWSVLNPGENGEIWFFPAPSTTGDIELQAYCVPIDLNSDDDYDAIPDGFKDAVKFGAATLAYLTKQQYAQASVMGQSFLEALGVDGVARDYGKTPNMYWRLFG